MLNALRPNVLVTKCPCDQLSCDQLPARNCPATKCPATNCPKPPFKTNSSYQIFQAKRESEPNSGDF